jgi:predicted transcriptional regulator
MASKTTYVSIRTSEEFRKRLGAAAEILDVPASQIVREGVTERLERLAASNERLKRALAAGEAQ